MLQPPFHLDCYAISISFGKLLHRSLAGKQVQELLSQLGRWPIVGGEVWQPVRTYGKLLLAMLEVAGPS
jgi:hypothetical protein